MRRERPFEPLPASFKPRTDWAAVAAQLREHPDAWAVVKVCRSRGNAATTAMRIRKGQIPLTCPAGHFDAESRLVDAEYRVYARYVGGGETA